MMKCFSPFFVFLGKPNGRIVQCEFPMYPQGMIYACQDNAWMDKRVMLMWVDMVLKPYVDTAPENVVPLLFLDSYHCHMMNSVVNAIQDLGVEVEHIPGGCTSLCQPVDIGINYRNMSKLKGWTLQSSLLTLWIERIPSTTPGAEPPRDVRDSGSARSHSTHLETSSSDRP